MRLTDLRDVDIARTTRIFMVLRLMLDRSLQGFTISFTINWKSKAFKSFLSKLHLANFYHFRVILDGEMLAWDPTVHKVVPFGTLKTFAAQGNSLAYPSSYHPH